MSILILIVLCYLFVRVADFVSLVWFQQEGAEMSLKIFAEQLKMELEELKKELEYLRFLFSFRGEDVFVRREHKHTLSGLVKAHTRLTRELVALDPYESSTQNAWYEKFIQLKLAEVNAQLRLYPFND